MSAMYKELLLSFAAYVNKINLDSPVPVKKNLTNDSGVAMPPSNDAIKMDTLNGRQYHPPDNNNSITPA